MFDGWAGVLVNKGKGLVRWRDEADGGVMKVISV
jgi:hypothetical protein